MKGKANVIMFVGLQGSGKTTTCTKVSNGFQLHLMQRLYYSIRHLLCITIACISMKFWSTLNDEYCIDFFPYMHIILVGHVHVHTNLIYVPVGLSLPEERLEDVFSLRRYIQSRCLWSSQTERNQSQNSLLWQVRVQHFWGKICQLSGRIGSTSY